MIVERRLSRTAVRDLGLVLSGAGLTALAAQISIPAVPVPFTLQTFSVTLCGLALGARRGAASQVAYLAAGAAGLPVFAEGKGSFVWLFGMTGGYLWAFIPAAALLGLLADRNLARRPLPLLGGLLSAHALILALGAAWLSLAVGLEKAWLGGILPFIAGAAIKSVAAAGIFTADKAIRRD
ncbi:MAG: biotin transporter BioY [Fimbriimonas sp.]